ncbi:MAG: acetate kinase [Patescibacteria group bacterium]
MAILMLNAGSSSLRFALFDVKLKRLYKGHIDAIGQKTCQFRRTFDDGSEEKNSVKAKNHQEALDYGLKRLQLDGAVKNLKEINKVGHRVVHGGESFKKATKLTPGVIATIKKLSELAPLHNPANLTAIEACKKLLPKAKHTAIFDTAFHQTLPPKAFLYGLPYELYTKKKIRRYGFHGTSHQYVAQEAVKILNNKHASLITCHIGNGVSLCAIKDGISLDTSMGFTPLEGPLMGTRSGTIDPAIIFHLLEKKSPADVHQLLEKESGFKGLSQLGSDVRTLWANKRSPGTRRTFDVFSYQMAKIIYSYFAALGGPPDALVFTAGIGENAFYLREQICAYFKSFGLKLDPRANKKNAMQISHRNSFLPVFVIPTNEELQMAKQV